MSLPLHLARVVARTIFVAAVSTIVCTASTADAAHEKAPHAKDKGAKDKATKEKGAKDKAAREKGAKDKAAREKAAKAKAAGQKGAKDSVAAEDEAPKPPVTDEQTTDAPSSAKSAVKSEEATGAAPAVESSGAAGRDAEDAPREAPAKDDEVAAMGSNGDLEVAARSLKLTKTARTRLASIATRYHAATGKRLVVTGGDRDAHQQAKLMYKKIEGDEDLLALYVRTELVRPILAAYEAEKSAKRHSERSVIAAMTKVIKAQVEQGEFVSRHLAFGAADVRARGLRDSDVAALKAAVRAEPGVQLVDERNSTSPHLHLGL